MTTPVQESESESDASSESEEQFFGANLVMI